MTSFPADYNNQNYSKFWNNIILLIAIWRLPLGEKPFQCSTCDKWFKRKIIIRIDIWGDMPEINLTLVMFMTIVFFYISYTHIKKIYISAKLKTRTGENQKSTTMFTWSYCRLHISIPICNVKYELFIFKLRYITAALCS